MFFIAWTNRCGRTDVGAIRSSALLKLLNERGVYPKVIDLWEPFSFFSKLKWATSLLIRMIKKRKQLVYVSCSPYNHLLIVILGVILGNHKLIVDFRDAYSIDIKERNYHGNHKFAQFIEKLLYKCCIKFIVVTPGIKKRYKKIFGNDDKIMVVLNGHELDREFLESLSVKNGKDSNIKVVYPGMYSPYFSIKQGKEYIDILKNELNKTGKKYEIIFLGTDIGTKKLLRGEKHIRFIPDTDDSLRLPYEETIKILNEADLVFMPIDNDYGCATKIYDYLALGLPIFNIINKDNWMHEYIGERIVNSCDNIHRFKIDLDGIYHRDNQMKKLTDYIYDEVININDPAYLG